MLIPYNRHTEERIEDRNARAEEFMEGRSGTYRTTAKAGLRFANATDRANSWFNNPKLQAAGGAAFGGASGAVVGGVISFVAIAVTVGAAWPLVPYIIGGMAAIGSGYYMVDNYQQTVNGGAKRKGAKRAERISEMAGAIPMDRADNPNPYLSPEQALVQAGGDPYALQQRTEALLNYRLPTPPAPAEPQPTEAPQANYTDQIERERAPQPPNPGPAR